MKESAGLVMGQTSVGQTVSNLVRVKIRSDLKHLLFNFISRLIVNVKYSIVEASCRIHVPLAYTSFFVACYCMVLP